VAERAEAQRRLTTQIDPELFRRLRMLAAATDRPIYDLVDEALKEFLDEQEGGDAS